MTNVVQTSVVFLLIRTVFVIKLSAPAAPPLFRLLGVALDPQEQVCESFGV
jgi:hypothetical protein